jgi:hypothetical protein
MRRDLARIARWLGAAALLGVGLDHLDALLAEHYDAIPTIGPLFALNVGAAAAVALALVLPLERFGPDVARLGRRLLAASGVGIAAGSLAGLLVSESSGLFGFHESGPGATILVAIVLEAATMALLGVTLALDRDT